MTAINIIHIILYNYVSTQFFFCFLDVFLSNLLYSAVWYNILTKPKKYDTCIKKKRAPIKIHVIVCYIVNFHLFLPDECEAVVVYCILI